MNVNVAQRPSGFLLLAVAFLPMKIVRIVMRPIVAQVCVCPAGCGNVVANAGCVASTRSKELDTGRSVAPENEIVERDLVANFLRLAQI